VEGQDQERVERVARLMARMAGGDPAAVFELYEQFGVAIAATVRRVLGGRGVMALPADEVDGLVIEVCLDLYGRAGSWSPDGGAMPWVWAERRIGNLVDRTVGQHADPLDVDQLDATQPAPPLAPSGGEPEVLQVLAEVARHRPVCALLADALGSVATERDRRVFLEVGIQASLGDQSPAVTVGALLGMQPDAVRQQHRRVKQRLRRLAANEARFAPLADLELVV
jgi:DNA-directed RNA polymerase specialized sigma24 family protein